MVESRVDEARDEEVAANVEPQCFDLSLADSGGEDPAFGSLALLHCASSISMYLHLRHADSTLHVHRDDMI